MASNVVPAEDEEQPVKSKLPKRAGTRTGHNQSYVLSEVLNCMREHLDFEEIGMWMVQKNVVSMEEYEEEIYDRILIATQKGQMKRSLAVTLLAGIVQKKGTFDEFMSALRESSVKVPAHILIVREIEDKLTAIANDDAEPDFPKQLIPDQETGDKSEEAGANPRKGRKLGFLARLLLLLMVPLFATIGAIFIAYSIRSFIGHEYCKITQEFALEAFNFIFGLLCLAVPIVFVLLVIISMHNRFRERFKNLWCTNRQCRDKLVAFTMLFVVAFFILAIIELIYSIFIAVQTYGHFNDWMNEFGLSPSDRTLNCTRAVFISTFASLTVYYILAFFGFCALFVFLIGPWIKTQIVEIYEEYVQGLLDKTVFCCCEDDDDGGGDSVPQTDGNNESWRRRTQANSAV